MPWSYEIIHPSAPPYQNTWTKRSSSFKHTAYCKSIIIHSPNISATLISFLRFKGNATRISRLLRDNPRTSLQQAADWIEHVHRHKGARHLRPEVYNLHWYQYYLLDVLAFLLTALFAFCIAVRMLFRLLCKILTKRAKGDKVSKQEWELCLINKLS